MEESAPVPKPDRKPPLDELPDAYLNRPLAALFVAMFKVMPITPNQITWGSIVFGIFGGVLLASDMAYASLYAALCVLALMVLDCADGQLARARGGGSRAGRILDGFADYVNSAALHVGLIFFLVQHGQETFRFDGVPLAPWLIVICAAASMAANAITYDAVKGRYKGMSGTADNETDTPEVIAAELKAARGLEERALLWLYLQYCRLQSAANKKSSPEKVEPEHDPARVRALYDVNLRCWSLIGPTTHLTGIGVAAALTPWFERAIEYYLWIAMIPCNIAMVLLLLWTAAIDRRYKTSVAQA